MNEDEEREVAQVEREITQFETNQMRTQVGDEDTAGFFSRGAHGVGHPLARGEQGRGLAEQVEANRG
jgi:hypothetical protein